MKVAIVGAGINGLYLAKKLAGKNHQVTVFEKRNQIGKIACSGLFSERIFEFFPESQKLAKNRINYGLVRFPKKTFKINFSKKFFVINHYELDNFAAEEAKSGGVEIVLNKEIKKEDFVLLQKDFDRIIGTDGPNSETRKYLGMKNPEIKLAIQGFIKIAGDWDFFETWPSKNGFLWKIPRGAETEYGIMEKPESAKNIFDKFLKEKNILLTKFESAIIPQGFLIPYHKQVCFGKAENQKITLSGDAAGLTKPWSGGGVIWGLTAADILLDAFPDFLQYKKEAAKFFLPKIFFSKLITKTGYFFGNNMPWILPKERRIESDFLI